MIQDVKENSLGESKKKPNEPFKISTGANLSQIVITHSNRYFFCSTSDPEALGSIRILRYPLTSEVYQFSVRYMIKISLKGC